MEIAIVAHAFPSHWPMELRHFRVGHKAISHSAERDIFGRVSPRIIRISTKNNKIIIDFDDDLDVTAHRIYW